MARPLHELLAIPDAGACCAALYTRVREALESVGAAPASPPEAVITYVSECVDMVGAGGLEYLLDSNVFELDPGLTRTIAGFEAIGMSAAGRGLEEMLGWFPSGVPPEDFHERRAAYASVDPGARELLDRRFSGDFLPECEARLVAYVSRNAAELEQLLSRCEEQARQPLQIAHAWDAGDLEGSELIVELMPRLEALDPSEVLLLIAGAAEVEYWLRVFCNRSDFSLLRAEPPNFFLKRTVELRR